MLHTPILFLVFNRPDTTQRVFAQIRKIQPKQLFVAADGAREGKEGEQEKVAQVRQLILEGIDWDCEVKTLFREENLGCGKAVSQAITWFFDNVEQGIILEDDTLPDLSFFPFCEQLLEKYKEDERIMMISGFNALGEHANHSHYLYSRIGAIWGWASWRRAWKHFTMDASKWKTAKSEAMLSNLFIKDENQAKYREIVLEHTFNGEIDTWDYFWTFARLSQSGLSIVSTQNLISNIGFGLDATHTKQQNELLTSVPVYTQDVNIQHPQFVYIDEEFDNQIFYKTIGFVIPNNSILHRLKTKIKNIIKYVTKSKRV